jgi:hypothetical protein
MYYLEVVYPHVQYPCNAPRVICPILKLYIHMYNILVMHHGSYFDIVHVDIQLHDSTYDPWCITMILYMWIYNSKIVHMTRGAIHCVELYIHIYNINALHHGSYVLSWSCISTCTISMYCTTGHMYYRGIVYLHVQYPCIATRVICTILELYIHIYNIHVLHHESYVLSWSCISTSTISLWIYNSTIVHMTRGAIH